jgi:hypothetical protein
MKTYKPLKTYYAHEIYNDIIICVEKKILQFKMSV